MGTKRLIFYCFLMGFMTSLRAFSQVPLDPSLVLGTGFNNQVLALEQEPGGAMVVGGSFTDYNGTTANRLARLLPAGGIDPTFAVGTAANGTIRDIESDAQGRLVLVGNFTSFNGTAANRIVRLLADGSRDTSFQIGTGFNREVWTVTMLPSGKIAVGGAFDSYQGVSSPKMIVLMPNGSIDTSFSVGAGFTPSNTFRRVNNIVVDAANRFLVAGDFTDYNGTTNVNRIVRLLSNGNRDTSFAVGSGANAEVRAVAIQSDGRILLAGLFNQLNGISTSRMVRLLPNGAVDATFNTGSGFDNPTGLSSSTNHKLLLLADGRIVVGGSFAGYQGVNSGKLVVLTPAGALSQAFGAGFGGNMDFVSDVALDATGRLVVAGTFTTYQGLTQNRLARLNTGFVPSTPAVPAFPLWDCLAIDSLSSYPALPSTAQLLALAFEPSGVVGFAVGSGGNVVKSTNRGRQWQVVTAPWATNFFIEDVYVRDSAFVSVVGTDFTSGSMGYYSTNGGQTWQASAIVAAAGYHMRYVSFFAPDSGYAVGESFSGNSRLYRTYNGGVLWDTLATFSQAQFVTVSFVDQQRGFLTGFDGIVRKTTNGGNSWVAVNTSFLQHDLVAVAFTSADTGVVAANRSGQSMLLRTYNAGTTWDTALFLGSARVYGLDARASVFLAAGDNSVHYSRNGAQSWLTANIPGNFTLRDIAYTFNDSALVVGGAMFGHVTERLQATLTTNTVAICAGNTAMVRASSSAGLVHWYADAALSQPLGMPGDTSLLRGPLLSNDTVYVIARQGNCASQVRMLVTTVIPNPTITNVSVQSLPVCSGDTAVVRVTQFAGSVVFYADSLRQQLMGTAGDSVLRIANLAQNDTVYIAIRSNGCESALRAVVLTVLPGISGSIVQQADSLLAPAFDSYQWINCQGNTAIAGATGRSFKPTSNGNYAVVVSLGACSDTLPCVAYLSSSLLQLEKRNQWLVYPNPAKYSVYIKSEALEGVQSLSYSVMNMQGAVVRAGQHLHDGSAVLTLPFSDLSAGIYWLQIQFLGQSHAVKISIAH